MEQNTSSGSMLLQVLHVVFPWLLLLAAAQGEMAASQATVHMVRKARLHTLRRAREVQKDKSLTCFTKDVRIALLRSTGSCNTAFQKFDVRNERAAALFGRALTSSLLMSCFNKGEERCILDFQAMNDTAPVRRIYAESMRLGEVGSSEHFLKLCQNAALSHR